jgi:putative flippase GtrA
MSLTQLARAAVGPAAIGRYGLIGITGVTLDFVLFVVLTSLGMGPLPATVISTLSGITNNYVLNARFNFGTGVALGSGWRFLAVGLTGLVVATWSLDLLLRAGMAEVAAKLVTVPCVAGAQYLANRYWSFRA